MCDFKKALDYIDLFEIELETIHALIKYTPATIKQNIKSKGSPSQKFQDELTTAITRITDDGYNFFKNKYKYTTQQIDLSLYDNDLPRINFSDFYWYPHLYESKDLAEQIPSDDNHPQWDEWRDSLWNRTTNISSDLDSKVTVIWGYPGSGKSTVMAMLLRAVYEDKLRNSMPVSSVILPIFIPLEIYSAGNIKSLVDAAVTYYGPVWNVSGIRLENFIVKNYKKIIFFLDGFDEVSINCRKKIRDQIHKSFYPSIVTSRYVDPAPGDDNVFSHNYYLGYLSKNDIVSHIDSIIANLSGEVSRTDEFKEVLAVLKGTIVNKLKSPSSELFHTRSESVETPIKSFEKEDKIKERKNNFTREELKIISSPILLNLHISSLLDLRGRAESIPDLLTRYVEFLIGKWRRSRRSLVMSPGEGGLFNNNLLELTDLHQALGFVAFISISYEHCLGKKITIDEVRHLLSEHLFYDRYEKEELISEFIDEAKSTQLLNITNNTCQFAYPHEYLQTLYSSIFIEFSENFVRSYDSNNIKEDNPSCFASHRRFLSNPNLRFLEESIVYFLIKKSMDVSVSYKELRDTFDYILASPPINEVYCGLDADTVNKLVPLNIILLGRVFSDNYRLKRRLPRITEILSQKIRKLYLETEIEFVYQALHGIYNGFDYNNKDINDDVYQTLEYKWRIAKSCKDLRQVIITSKEIDNDNLRDRIERRVVYKYRYHACTFEEEDFNFLNDYSARYETSDEIESQSRRLLVFNSLRIIKDNIDKYHKDDSVFFNKIELSVNQTEDKIGKYRKESIEIMQPLVGKAFTNPEKFIDLFYEVRFTIKKIFPRQFIKELSIRVDKESFQNFIRILKERLQQAQEEEKTLIIKQRTNSEPVKKEIQLNISIQGSLVLLLTYMADTFYGQQFLMPKDFSIQNLINKDIGDLDYDQSEIIKLLFNGAKEGVIDSKNAKEAINKDIGGWQLYDIYVHSIWRILHYLPSNAHYEYLY